MNATTEMTPRTTEREFTAREKIRIVLRGLSGRQPVAELCRNESIPLWLYSRWCMAFLDAGKAGLQGDGAPVPREQAAA
jgi:transposase-like protein